MTPAHRVPSYVFAASVAFVTAAGAGACSSDAPAGAGPIDASVGDAPAEAAADDGGDATAAPAPRVFAVKTVYFGDAPMPGQAADAGGDAGPSSTAWKAFGRDIDGKVSTSASTDTCTPASGAAASVKVDGDAGNDDSFGANVLPLLLSLLGSDFPAKYNASVATGAPTPLLAISGLHDDPAETASNVPGQIFGGAAFGGPSAPTFTTADDWPVDPSTLADGKTLASGAKSLLPGGAVASGAWSSGADAELLVPLKLTTRVTLHVKAARVTFVHASAHEVARGMISGVVPIADLTEAFHQVIGSLDPQYCSGPVYDNIVQALKQAQDILDDGTNRADTPCNAVSIGLGFEAEEVGPLRTVAPASTAAAPCP